MHVGKKKITHEIFKRQDIRQMTSQIIKNWGEKKTVYDSDVICLISTTYAYLHNCRAAAEQSQTTQVPNMHHASR